MAIRFQEAAPTSAACVPGLNVSFCQVNWQVMLFSQPESYESYKSKFTLNPLFLPEVVFLTEFCFLLLRLFSKLLKKKNADTVGLI